MLEKAELYCLPKFEIQYTFQNHFSNNLDSQVKHHQWAFHIYQFVFARFKT